MKDRGPWSWFLMLLQLIFIILKLCKVIAWSWWWVMSPLIISGSFIAILMLIVGILAVSLHKDGYMMEKIKK
jgi:hypothetical protein